MLTTTERPKFEKLPKRVQAVIAKTRGGQRLCKFLRLKETLETEVVFFFEPSGKRAPPKSAADAIKSGYLVPAGDGLLGPESSQTFTAA